VDDKGFTKYSAKVLEPLGKKIRRCALGARMSVGGEVFETLDEPTQEMLRGCLKSWAGDVMSWKLEGKFR